MTNKEAINRLADLIGDIGAPPIDTTAHVYEERLYKNRPTFFSTFAVYHENIEAWMSLPGPYTGE